jgi:hypothetical protein
MKKVMFFGVVFVVFAVSVSAQSLYFDLGLGFGKAWTKIDGEDAFDALIEEGGNDINEVAVDIGFKIGGGPFGNMPLYFALEFGGIGHQIYDDEYYLQFNSYIVGPSVMFYPVSYLQLGGSFGFSFVANDTDVPDVVLYGSKEGYAWNVSAAFDIGKRNHGFLIGIKYFYAKNTLKVTNAEQVSSMAALFFKYAYRTKKNNANTDNKREKAP